MKSKNKAGKYQSHESFRWIVGKVLTMNCQKSVSIVSSGLVKSSYYCPRYNLGIKKTKIAIMNGTKSLNVFSPKKIPKFLSSVLKKVEPIPEM